MSFAISSQMTANLIALTQVNSDIDSTKGRLASGVAIASASDNISVYFKAQTYLDKANAYDTVNKGIGEAVSYLDNVDKALANMQENLKGALQVMKDARTKAVSYQSAARTQGDNTYANRAAVAANPNAVPPTVAVMALTGAIVSQSSPAANSATAPPDQNDASMFQQNDVFSVTMTGADGVGVTKFFKATDPNQAPSDKTMALNAANGQWGIGANNADGSQPAAYNFNDLASLKTAMEKAFGTSRIQMNVTTVGTGSKLGFTLQNPADTIKFEQTNDQVVKAPAGSGAQTDAGAAFDFSVLFGKQNEFTLNGGALTFDAKGLPTEGFTKGAGVSTNSNGYKIFSYSSIGSTDNDALDARTTATSMYKQTLLYLQTTTKDATLPGFSNVLKGETMTVDLNDLASVQQTVKLTKATDPLSLGFAGYSVNNGTVSTTNAANNFNTDASLDAAMAEVKSAISSMKQSQSYLAASKLQMNSRLDYNKTLVNSLQQGANRMTAADTTLEATNLASLQTRQSFAQNNLALTKQAEQSLIQLLR